ncbi:hypothetical protein NM208_g1061 [Fusarium decemcellulare]|uniref:Uncharacterized protein n=1 Tax=Fusarium decemcellulare TaxID=57161 RepID=A0ACC1SXE7_9HYPO|nr:hypothetical protein NM208_g1061 [Fusarium decemcellulare]
MASPKVLLLGNIVYAHKAWNALSKDFGVVTTSATNRPEFIQECKSGKFSGVVAIYRTSPSTSITGLIDKELVEALPDTVKFVSHNGAGYDQVDVAACTQRSIQVSNTPSAVDDATADTAVFLMIGALRRFNEPMLSLRSGSWLGNSQPGHDPQKKVLGIVGFGGIGKTIARRAKAFDMKVQYYSRNRVADEEGCSYVSLNKLLETSDVVSLSVPLNEHTKHMISYPEFEKMKPGVVIINTARGPVVDEDALVKALERGKVGSAGLDVFEEEPKVHPGLLNNPKVILLPHVGTFTVETRQKMEEWALDNVRQAVEKGTLKSRVPEQANLTF